MLSGSQDLNSWHDSGTSPFTHPFVAHSRRDFLKKSETRRYSVYHNQGVLIGPVVGTRLSLNIELSSGKRVESVIPLALVRQGGSPLFFSLVRFCSSLKILSHPAATSILTWNQKMVSDQTSSESSSDRISYFPSTSATSVSLPPSDATSWSHHCSPSLPEPIITDCSAVRDAATSDQPDLVDENDIVIA